LCPMFREHDLAVLEDVDIFDYDLFTKLENFLMKMI